MVRFCPLFSGSSGNCTYVESENGSILIDAGVSLRAITKALAEIGADIHKIDAVFVTHEHSDHIRGLTQLAKKHSVPIYASSGTLEGIAAECRDINIGCLKELATGCGIEAGGLYVRSFETSHDSRESVGYRVQTADGHAIAVATDLGFVDGTVLSAISSCEIVMLESNHDVGMLRNGRYPYFLKRRILSERGHLSNEDCAAVLPALVEEGARHIVLAHLSRDNNLPELAVQTALSVLQMSGVKAEDGVDVEAAPPMGPGRVYAI